MPYVKKEKEILVCQQCGRKFLTKMPHAKACSRRCAVYLWRFSKTGKRTTSRMPLLEWQKKRNEVKALQASI